MKYNIGDILLIVGDEEKYLNLLGQHQHVGKYAKVFVGYDIDGDFAEPHYAVFVDEGDFKFDGLYEYYVWESHLMPLLTEEEARQKAVEMLG